jgi:parallel beta-helix repeat protein
MSIDHNAGPGKVGASYGRRETVNSYDRFNNYDDKVFFDKDNKIVGREGKVVEAGVGYSITSNPLVDPTGVADATAFMQDALAKNGTVSIPDDARIRLNMLDMPENTHIVGGGTIVYGDETDYVVRVTTDSSIKGVSFETGVNRSVNRIVIWTANCQRPVIEGCKFLGAFRPLDGGLNYERWITLDQNTKEASVRFNDVNCGGIGVLALRNTGSVITDNNFYFQRNAVSFYGGVDNKVIKNTIIGRDVQYPGDIGNDAYATVSGISFLSFGFLGTNRGVVGNIIADNIISGISEEAISLDCNGDSFTDTPENPYLPIGTAHASSTSGSRTTITIKEALVGAPLDWWYNCYINVLTGSAAGATVKIMSGSASESIETSTLVIPSNGGILLTDGDKFTVSYGIVYNQIRGNKISRSNTGICLWGSAWQNSVTNNQVKAMGMGICVATVASVAGETAAYSGSNLIHGNTVIMEYEDAPIGSTKGTSADSSPITIGTWAYGTPTITAQNPGIMLTDNIIVSGKDCKIGGSTFAIAAAGVSTVTGIVVQGNRSVGGGSFSVNYTDKTQIGRNYTGSGRLDYNTTSSGNNTNLATMA